MADWAGWTWLGWLALAGMADWAGWTWLGQRLVWIGWLERLASLLAGIARCLRWLAGMGRSWKT